MDETGLDSLSMFPPGSKQSAVTWDITSTIGSVNSPSMPRSSKNLSWMGSNTHWIQAGWPSGLNPDGCQQLARRSTRERGETPFDYNQYDHQVGGSPCVFVCKADLFPIRSIGMKSVPTCRLKKSRTEPRTWVQRRPSQISGGMTSSR